MDRKKKNNSNAGMTLLEVIIAVSIFSITAIVLLQSFVTSGRINRKSNLYLEATTVAQNIMEEIKAKKFEEVSLAFNYPIDSSNSARLTFLDTQKSRINNGQSDELGVREILESKDNSNQVTYTSVKKYVDGMDEANVTASVISTDNGKTYKFNPRKTGDNASKYYFELTNVTNNHETFDALVEFDGSKTSGYKKKTATNNEEGKNDYLAPNISKLDTTYNAPFIVEKQKYLDRFTGKDGSEGLLQRQLRAAQRKWADDLAEYCGDPNGENYKDKFQEFCDKYAEPTILNAEDVFNSAKKTLLVTIEYNKETGKVSVDAQYTIDAYDYVSKDDPVYGRMDLCACDGDVSKEDSNSGEYFCTIVSKQNFYTSSVENALKNIYIFYYPNYNSKSSINPLDEIIVENENNYPVNLYIVKQQDENNKDTHLLDESKYRMSLRIKEKPSEIKTTWSTNPSLFRSQIKLRTNLDYNISEIYKKLDRPKVSQMKLSYEDVEGRAPVSGTTAKKILDYNGLDDREEKDRIYAAKVSIYKTGAAAKGFPDDELILTLDGTEEN